MSPARTTLQYGLLLFCRALLCINSTPCRGRFNISHAFFYSGGTNFTTFADVPSAAVCGVKCSRDEYCRSMMFVPSSGECRTYPHKLGNLPSSGTTPAIFGEIEKGSCHEGWLFEGCSSDADCSSFNNSICYDSVCRCQHGYSYAFRTDSCVESCQQYGTRYTQIPYYIENLNTAAVSANSVSECATLCTERGDFLCRFIEYYNRWGTCYLHEDTGLSQPGAFFYLPSEWINMQRDCA